jgi:GntR family transcriptional regulator / MocR family aminotransferase
VELILTLDPQIEKPLHQQLSEELRHVILTGRLLPGQRLPSTRSLAHTLNISRTTVTQSYEHLLSEGYLETHHGSGTFVCTQLPDNYLQSEPATAKLLPETAPVQLSRYGSHLADTPFALLPEPTIEISFRYGRPALTHFPVHLWRKLIARHCRADLTWLDYATDPQGYYPLRVAIAQYLARARAVNCDPSQILMTNGTQQALDLVLRIFLEPGEILAIEDPGYLSARRVFLSHGAQLLPIPMDEAGLQVEKLTVETRPIRCVYVTPSHQFPTGAVLSLPRRFELLKWAQQTGALILEDDYDSEYRYGDRPISALQGLGNNDSVLYFGTFSKVLFPSLRLGYLVLPKPLVSLVAYGKWLSDRQLPVLEQRVLTDFMIEGHFESHIRKMRSHYNHCRQTLVQGLKTHFGDRVTILGDQAGIHVMVRFATTLTDDEIQEKAATAGVGLMPAEPYYLQGNNQNEFILGYGELEAKTIQIGIDRLAQIL